MRVVSWWGAVVGEIRSHCGVGDRVGRGGKLGKGRADNGWNEGRG